MRQVQMLKMSTAVDTSGMSQWVLPSVQSLGTCMCMLQWAVHIVESSRFAITALDYGFLSHHYIKGGQKLATCEPTEQFI